MTIIQNPDKLDEELYDAVLMLLPQLTTRRPLPTFADVSALLSSNCSKLFIARHPNLTSSIAGMLTLVIFRVPSGIRAHIEDVVVDRNLRNEGIARELMSAALRSAKEAGANGVALTSHPRRLAANGLYKNLGFKKWDTNLYFYQFD
jgi:ribosomal protein S18 acetylase RimI-like enzyme